MRLATVTDSLLAELRITEIFFSLQGEARTVGLPTVFIRLTGCPLRCSYCDTTYSFTGGEKYTLTAIMQQVADYGAKYVCVTGGEPLAQPNCLPLLTALCDAGYQVSLETSGALDISQVDRRVSKVVDLKTPDSGEAHRNLYENMQHLTANDQIKFVICSRQDYQWAKFKIDAYQLNQRVSDVLLSPSHQQQDPRELAEWILADKLAVRLQVQLHKYLWNNEAGH
ncbi:MAG TPA: 7-carboxy-7-deazaguanine synthase QueE [Agitococcus sp.]|nr:7-carboxy-7-deazaguanine synthase QueE [Agitococcus sp.]HNE90278.1 7-carboxy-7-deazaguanine synthase QueE [Agitococcus sp.]